MRDEEDRQSQIAARLLGMKHSEIVDVTTVEGGVVITTHDGQRTLATADVVVGPWTGEIPTTAEPPPDDELPSAEPPPDDEPAPPERHRRGGKRGGSGDG
ncbi:MAG: hypothetical protein ACRDRZ_03675 [Pseudonocardiaceae bacterium]